jgi:plastocyanin
LLLALLVSLLWMGQSTVNASPPSQITVAQVVKLLPSQDSYVISTEPSMNYATDPLRVAPESQAYVQFDLATLPDDISVDKAVLRMKPSEFPGNPASDVFAGQVDAAWVEETVTWESKPLATAGVLSATLFSQAWAEWEMTSLVQSWVDGAANHGFLLTTEDAGVTFYSREAAMAPELVITFTATNPAPQPGQLLLTKSVETGDEVVGFGETVTYTLRLQHEGGLTPMNADVRDVLTAPLHLAGPVTVQEITPNAHPLRAHVRFERNPHNILETVIEWQGMLSPNAVIELSFPVHVHPFCPAEAEQVQIANTAVAHDQEGVAIEATATFPAACPSANVKVEQTLSPNDGGIVGPGQTDRKTVLMALLKDATVLTTLTNQGSEPVTLGMELRFEEIKAEAITVETGNRPAHVKSICKTITLAAGDDYAIESRVNLADLLGGSLPAIPEDPAEDLRMVSTVRYVLLPPDEEFTCGLLDLLDPALVRQQIFDYKVRPWDLGDAPDSTNHFGAGMEAYPGVPANFPTVFDPATDPAGAQGPAHARPHPFHLGAKVELEPDADAGPLPLNIVPATGLANQDRFDDGLRPLTWPPAYCQPISLTVDIFISPVALTWFAEEESPAILNSWLDFNHDGDWADLVECQPEGGSAVAAPEQILIDQPIDVAALGPGLHTLTIQTGPIAWTGEAQAAAWLRLTLSEQLSVKLADKSYGDGRGGNAPFRLGETQDHLLRAPDATVDGPDMAVALRAGWHPQDKQAGDEAATKVIFTLAYANQGTESAKEVVLSMQPPTQFAAQSFGFLAAPPLESTQIQTASLPYAFALGEVEAGQGGVIVLWWAGEFDEVYSGSAQVTSAEDLNPANNSAVASVETIHPGLGFGFKSANGPFLVQRGTTCRNSFELDGFAPPQAQVQIRHNGNAVGAVLADEYGRWRYTVSGLTTGLHRFEASLQRGQSGPPTMVETVVAVDTDLLVDPVTLEFVNQNGRHFHPDTQGWQQGDWQLHLPEGSYAAGINACGVLTPEIHLQLGQHRFGLTDEDGDHRYLGNLVVGPNADIRLAAVDQPLSLVVTTDGMEISYAGMLSVETAGTIQDAAGMLADATVTLLAEQADTMESCFCPWDGTGYGQVNPQQSGSDGSYSFSPPAGLYRLYVAKEGYQPYRTGNLAVDGLVNQTVTLTPRVDQQPDYVVEISPSGFNPAILWVEPGAMIEFANTDLDGHRVTATSWDSGLLLTGERYQVVAGGAGSYLYTDGSEATHQGFIIVGAANGLNKFFLPVVQR